MGIGELLNELFGAEKEEMECKVKVSDIEEVDASVLVNEASKIITFAENDDKDGYFANEERLTKQYGKMGALYMIEFTDQLMSLVEKFKSVSKRSICLMAIMDKADHVVVVKK